ncbi:poly(ADP-ribose) polymerase catalytic domain-containing protein [Ditylenchus destructor]|uniref:Poly(ADP-ribose) polymerase catalytic domain-containing protein n=1 Tax=Ditylenchus destructor TaxID=166010 RepID=A0AAD4MJG4_9BILA|nr:poly(ADP-ribose) polymerase catalytic domain-containing protein [Ditylenchus destructor]
MMFHDWTLSLYGIENDPGVTHIIKLKAFHEDLIQTLPLKHIHAAIGKTYLSPKWHVDLRCVEDDGKTRFRGGVTYSPPLGCMRFGIRVLGKYDDNKVERNQTNTHGEWPVAYHGTSEQSVLSILVEGFQLEKGKRFAYGKGIYCTPDPKTALEYAYVSQYEGEELRLIIQCRVDPAKMQVVAQPIGHGEYWLVPTGEDIRPYAVCAYEEQSISIWPLVSNQNIIHQQRHNTTPAMYQNSPNSGNIYGGASAVPLNALNANLNAGNQIASQSSPSSPSAIYNGYNNYYSNAPSRGAATPAALQGTAYQSTLNSNNCAIM